MSQIKPPTARLRLLATTVLGAAMLAACNQAAPGTTQSPSAALPLTDVSSGPTALAPTADALPPAPPAPVTHLRNRDEGYAYINRAYYVDDAFADAPPDYGFDYDGSQPWVWRGENRAYRVVERLPSGDRYYYYEPGADQPYLVRDPDYAYGYDQGRLVVVYDSRGRLLADDQAARRADYAGRYLYRARTLYQAAQRDNRQAVARDAWSQRRAAIQDDRARLDTQRRDDAQWRDYDQQHAAQEQARWTDERARRQAEASRQDQNGPGRGGDRQRADNGRPPMTLPGQQQPGPTPQSPPLAGPAERAQADARAAQEAQRKADQARQQAQDAQRAGAASTQQAEQARRDAGVAKAQADQAGKQAAAAEQAKAQAQKQADIQASRMAEQKAHAEHNAQVQAAQAAAQQRKGQEQAQAQAKAQQVAAQKAADLARHQQHTADVQKAQEARDAAKAAAAREKDKQQQQQPPPH